jgi:hypothetical protein
MNPFSYSGVALSCTMKVRQAPLVFLLQRNKNACKVFGFPYNPGYAALQHKLGHQRVASPSTQLTPTKGTHHVCYR